MSKLICFRVDDDQKARIEAAAAVVHRTVSTFIKENIMKAVEGIESRPESRQKTRSLFDVGEDNSVAAGESSEPEQKKGGPAPTWFRDICKEAARGGSFGFHRVGYRWTSNMPDTTPLGFTRAQWQEQIRSMNNALSLGSLGGKWRKGLIEVVLAWFDRNFPSHMELIPSRRRREFAQGFVDAANDLGRMRAEWARQKQQ
jgi:hypothetical protein